MKRRGMMNSKDILRHRHDFALRSICSSRRWEAPRGGEADAGRTCPAARHEPVGCHAAGGRYGVAGLRRYVWVIGMRLTVGLVCVDG